MNKFCSNIMLKLFLVIQILSNCIELVTAQRKFQENSFESFISFWAFIIIVIGVAVIIYIFCIMKANCRSCCGIVDKSSSPNFQSQGAQPLYGQQSTNPTPANFEGRWTNQGFQILQEPFVVCTSVTEPPILQRSITMESPNTQQDKQDDEPPSYYEATSRETSSSR